MRIDLHVHSKFSLRPSAWFLQKINCPESFTEPLHIYRVARQKGMSLVTITDHNRIDGALEIAHLPGTFISEEITTYFPEDQCKLHVLAWHINEKQHTDIQHLRKDVFELVGYLRRENICHALAHPLYAVNDRLTVEHIEILLLLFKVFEINGARNDVANVCLEQIIDHLTPAVIDRLVDRHGIAPEFDRPWEKCLVGGSDDHSSLNIARTHTRLENAHSVSQLIDGIRSGSATVARRVPSPETMAHNLYGIAYQFYRNKFGLKRHENKDVLLRFLDRTLRGSDIKTDNGFMSRLVYLWHHRRREKNIDHMSGSLLEILQRETRKMLDDDPVLRDMTRNGGEDDFDTERMWFDFVNRVSSRVLVCFAQPLFEQMTGANVFNLFQTVGSAGGLYTMLAPYFIAYSLFARDKRFCREVRLHFDIRTPRQARGGREVRVAHFTDTFYEVNGVALTLQQQARTAVKNGKHLTMVTCQPDAGIGFVNAKNFTPIGQFDLPEYPQQKIYYPPLLEMLQYCYDQQITHIHCATPGPVGLAGLALAKILQLPMTGTYHTSLPQYAMFLTGDDVIQELTWKYMLWFYDQMDVVYAPSESTREELVAKGIEDTKVRCYPRGIDTIRFHPDKRNGLMTERFAIEQPLKLLYVGRVSKEKNLHLLAASFKRLLGAHPDAHLVVVGDGPYMAEMRSALAGLPVTFTGYLAGEELAAVYASCDLFVFPSTTDTFGNVVLEAQASGLPVVVTDQGGPCENMIPGETGRVVPADSVDDLTAAVGGLLKDEPLRRRMGRAARDYMEQRSFEAAFMKTWQLFEDLDSACLETPARAG